MPFAIPVTWREPKNLVDDWHFCCVSFTSFSAKNKHKIVYPNLNSAVRLISHDDNLPVQDPPENGLAFLDQMECENGSSPAATQHCPDNLNTTEKMTSEQKLFNQQELNTTRDVSMSKDKAELLASRLKERSLLESDDRICLHRIRNNVLKTFVRVDGPMVFCNDISGLCKGLKQEQDHRRLFIDS